MIEDFKWKVCILNNITTGLFHKIVQKWKYPVVKSKIPPLFMSKRNVFTPYMLYVKMWGKLLVVFVQNPLLLTKEVCIANAFWLLTPFVRSGACALLQQILAWLWFLLVRLTHRSTSYLSEHFHLKHINLFAVSESLLNNWVVLIEVTAFWSLY